MCNTTKYVIKSRGITWLSKSYGVWKVKNQINEDEDQNDNEEESMGIDIVLHYQYSYE